MLLQNLDSWLVPQNILQEIMIVGVRFDICSDTSKLMKMMERCLLSEAYDAREYKMSRVYTVRHKIPQDQFSLRSKDYSCP